MSPPWSDSRCSMLETISPLIVDFLDVRDWTRLCATSKDTRKRLSSPFFWKILFQEILGLPAAAVDGDHRQIAAAAFSFLHRSRPDPYAIEQRLWGAVSRSRRLWRQVRQLSLIHRAVLFERWPHTGQLARPESKDLEDWIVDRTLPDSIGVQDLDSFEMFQDQICIGLPETACFWRPLALTLQGYQSHSLPLAFGCLLDTLKSLDIHGADIVRFPESFLRYGQSSASLGLLGTRGSLSSVCLQQSAEPVCDKSVVATTKSSSRIGSHTRSASIPRAVSPPPFPPLSQLQLSKCRLLVDLECVRPLVNLTTLSISECPHLHSLAPLSSLSRLRYLQIVSCPLISNIEPLASLQQLQHLGLSRCHAVRSFRPLALLGRLGSLDLSGCIGLESLDDLSSLVRLARLDVSSCPSLTSLDSLDRLASLTSLTISGCRQIPSLSPVAALRKLKTLSASDCVLIESLEPLHDLPGLDQLFVCQSHPGAGLHTAVAAMESHRAINALTPTWIMFQCAEVYGHPDPGRQ
ncbi:uncharacterized protein BJ171DRAFT_521650 [Polychytrium aggregatum]|uniref:uncharacterized protein n=1 Tax=Polychytrium aggregatum TaxID=110093 RepID=UPI0022FF32B0|nr:uncharacterized protein BJ171DRAFT_521650 [Polychytrium aggregatum]KAI9197232.1 hypothetical protein BJ171DRAFT_521650 [Polychytrium aggregatum]